MAATLLLFPSQSPCLCGVLHEANANVGATGFSRLRWSTTAPREFLVQGLTHMDPAQGDEIILVLYEEELLLILRVAIVGAAALLGNDDVRHAECVSGLERQTLTFSR